MSETTQATVEDFEEEIQTADTDAGTSTEPEKDGGVKVMDDHTPIGPEGRLSGGIETMDDHTPIGAESVVEEGAGK
ncbi:hypothetical protein [Streptomyces sp. WMMB 322]|uniref:hypothetical protein n=1 Tax=Streptomyces sp. WMMB 322 TaxID=1286821 RepID=UPI0006E2BF4C|nr:hypothetical protein [Streptomyces sp. WMMB 322]SCK07841.1 hypothetical protein H180DRAFT_00316 [Streptomyces sp. WMMB 322]